MQLTAARSIAKQKGPLAGLSRRARRATLWGVALTILLLGAAVFAAVRQLGEESAARAAFALEAGRLVLPGLAAPVEVLRDARGIPHIEALRELDGWMALGFVHAQDRLGQMLWMRRLARGRTAELTGKPGLIADRLARTLAIGRHADAEAERLDDATRDALLAYAQGINARLARIRDGQVGAPAGLDRSGERFEDWSPADSIAIVKLIAWSTSNLLETGIVLDDLIERLGSQLARPFRPTGVGVQGVELPSALTLDEIARAIEVQPPGEPTAASHELVAATSLRRGSAWVISARHTAGGAPILVADLQLPPTAPALVYEIQLRAAEIDVAGATIPGVPVVWAGRNLHVAWAISPAHAVTVDLFKETLREREALYQNGSRWVPLEQRRELIGVRTAGGGLRDEELVVRSTRHGPLINPLLHAPGYAPPAAAAGGPQLDTPSPLGGRSVREPLALSWSGMRPGNGIASLLALARARDADAVVAALAQHHEPVVAVVYADARGAAGMQLAGWLPQRTLPTSLVPVPGRLRLFDWDEPIAYGELPAIRIDASRDGGLPGRRSSYLVAADGPLDDKLTAAGIEWLWRTGERTRRLEARLQALTAAGAPPLDLRAAAALQTDVVGAVGREVIPPLLRLARAGGPLRPEALEIAQLLGRWDGSMALQSAGAAAYVLLMEHLIEDLFRAPFGDTLYARYLALPGVRPAAVVVSVIRAVDQNGMPGAWADPARVGRAVREGLRKTWVSLSYRLGPSRDGWAWGRLHEIDFRAFVGLPALAAGVARALPRVGVAGDETTLGSAGFGWGGSHLVTSAASYRIAVDLAAPDRMLSSLAPGQSEHLQHPHFADGLPRWLEGRPSLLLTSRLMVEEESGARLLLEPGP